MANQQQRPPQREDEEETLTRAEQSDRGRKDREEDLDARDDDVDEVDDDREAALEDLGEMEGPDA